MIAIMVFSPPGACCDLLFKCDERMKEKAKMYIVCKECNIRLWLYWEILLDDLSKLLKKHEKCEVCWWEKVAQPWDE